MAGLRDGLASGGGSIGATSGTFSGNVTLGDASGDAITVTGTATFAQAATFTSGLTSNGAITLGAGDDLIGSSTSDITINTNKFTVAGATGNTLVAGTFAVTSTSVFTGGITANGGLTLGAGDDLIGSATSDITMNTDKFTVAGATGNTLVAGTLEVTGLITATAGATGDFPVVTLTASTGVQSTAISRTATADGLTTGTIAAGTSMVAVVDSSNAAFWITLPAPVPGNIVWLLTSADATGFEVRTSTPASIAINGGSGGGAESAIPATAMMVRFVCVSATAWVASMWDADGDEAKVEAAAA